MTNNHEAKSEQLVSPIKKSAGGGGGPPIKKCFFVFVFFYSVQGVWGLPAGGKGYRGGGAPIKKWGKKNSV